MYLFDFSTTIDWILLQDVTFFHLNSFKMCTELLVVYYWIFSNIIVFLSIEIILSRIFWGLLGLFTRLLSVRSFGVYYWIFIVILWLELFKHVVYYWIFSNIIVFLSIEIILSRIFWGLLGLFTRLLSVRSFGVYYWIFIVILWLELIVILWLELFIHTYGMHCMSSFPISDFLNFWKKPEIPNPEIQMYYQAICLFPIIIVIDYTGKIWAKKMHFFVKENI